MFKKSPRIYFLFLFFVIIGNDVHAVSSGTIAWDTFASFFNCCCSQNAAIHVISTATKNVEQDELNAAIHVISTATENVEQGEVVGVFASQGKRSGPLVKNLTPSAAFVTRDKVDDKTRAEILETIEKIKKKFASVPVTTQTKHSSISDKNTFTVTRVAIYKESELKTHDHSVIQKLVITDMITEENKGRFFLKVSEFQNLEELILENCEELWSIPIDKLLLLPKLRHLSLYKACMDFRYPPYFNDTDFKIVNLLDVLNIPSLKNFTLQVFDLTEEDKDNLLQHAQKKGITVTLY